MTRRRWILYSIIGIVILTLLGIITFNFLLNNKRLTSEERKWINDSINDVQNVYVTKDANIFSKDGEGVFYSFLNDFSEEYDLKLNIITIDETVTNPNYSLEVVKSVSDNDNVFYKDHYVLLSKDHKALLSNRDLEGQVIGILNSELEYVKNYLKEDNISFNGYNTKDELYTSLSSGVNYILVPRMEDLDRILSNNLEIVYHLDDINNSYVLKTDSEIFGKILNKYFETWQNKINENIKEQEFKMFTKYLNISEKDIDSLLSVDYRYGFVNNSPYEVIMSGNYGGIIAEYLKEFSDFSKVHFDIKKYRNNEKLIRDINRGKVDIYFGFSNLMESNYLKTKHGINNSLSIITTKDSDKMIDSIYGLQGETVYVEDGSNLMNYLKSIGNIDIKTFSSMKELFKLNKEDVIIALDTYIFNFYSSSKLSNYTSKYETFIDNQYHFRINAKWTVLNKLFDRYINYLDEENVINKGIKSHDDTILSGNILNSIAKYFILSIIAILVIGFAVYKNSKRIRIAKRIRKDDKYRFIDDLTCLKNRAYLSDSIKSWNNNTIYPQTVIVVDLNKLKDINDKYGVVEGDKQIQGLANALIKTQLDNSDIMRSDGNEFVIYAVGYSQKQIVNYIHKINKELKKLPYDFGAEFGYSVIENNLKTVEDALNEATNAMKSKKASNKE